MVIVIKGSKADLYLTNLTKANRLTADLPAEVRAEIIYLSKQYVLNYVKINEQDHEIVANFITNEGKLFSVQWVAELKGFEVKWSRDKLQKADI